MWMLDTPWYELVIRGTVIFFFVFIVMRIWGKKHLGEIALFDFILLLFISEAIQNSLADDEKSLPGGMILIITLLFWNTIINKLTYRSPKLEKILEGSPKVIIKNGVIDHNLKDKEQMTDEDLYSALRREGVLELKNVKQATLETNGHLSVVQKQ